MFTGFDATIPIDVYSNMYSTNINDRSLLEYKVKVMIYASVVVTKYCYDKIISTTTNY